MHVRALVLWVIGYLMAMAGVDQACLCMPLEMKRLVGELGTDSPRLGCALWTALGTAGWMLNAAVGERLNELSFTLQTACAVGLTLGVKVGDVA